MSLLAVLVPRVLGLLSREARGLIVAVVELAKGAHEIGPPDPPPHVAAFCRTMAGRRVPWQLVAAALAVRPGDRDRVPELVAAVEELGTVPGVRRWTNNHQEHAGLILLTFLTFTARNLDPDGLQDLARTFAPDETDDD